MLRLQQQDPRGYRMTATTAAGAEALAASEIPSSSLWRIRIGSVQVSFDLSVTNSNQ